MKTECNCRFLFHFWFILLWVCTWAPTVIVLKYVPISLFSWDLCPTWLEILAEPWSGLRKYHRLIWFRTLLSTVPTEQQAREGVASQVPEDLPGHQEEAAPAHMVRKHHLPLVLGLEQGSLTLVPLGHSISRATQIQYALWGPMCLLRYPDQQQAGHIFWNSSWITPFSQIHIYGYRDSVKLCELNDFVKGLRGMKTCRHIMSPTSQASLVFCTITNQGSCCH